MLIGLTGGIASGKTTVCRLFERYGVDVIDADVVAREVIAPGSEGFAEVVRTFGSELLDNNDQLDRRALRRIVFDDPVKRKQLEAIIHPRVRSKLWEGAQQATSPYVILAIPLLVEGGLNYAVDRVLVVDISEHQQRTRLASRDGIKAELIDQMLAAQTTRERRLAVANDVIDNDGPRESLNEQVAVLHRRYLSLSQSTS